METLILIAKIIVMGAICGIAAFTIGFVLLSFYAFLLNLFSDDKDY